MTMPDVNVLVYAHRPEIATHPKTREWLESALMGAERIAVWDVILSSAYRILTNPRMALDPRSPKRALDFLTEVRSVSVVLSPGARHWDILSRLVTESGATGNLVTDATIAAIAIEHHCRIATFDRDFARFPGVDWFEPIPPSD